MGVNIKREDIGNLMFATSYISKYRYFKQKLLENEHDTLQEVTPNLRMEQYENLRQMIEIEMIINAVQYCSELGAFAITVKNKKIYNIIQMLSSLAETDIKIFYDKIKNRSKKDIWKYMGYYEIKITCKEDYEKYYRSCDRYKSDIVRLSTFYNNYYQLYVSYKHGLRIIPSKNEKGEKLIFEACKDNTMTIHVVPEMWYLEAIEITEIINNIHGKLYIPLVRQKFAEFCHISLKDKSIKQSIKSTDPPDPTRPFSFKTSINFPWWVHDGKEPNPFY
jgi:hypothetical protein